MPVLVDQQQPAAQYWKDFQTRNPGHFAQFERHPERAEWLTAIFDCSRFLAEEILRHPEWLESIFDLNFALTREDFERRLNRFLQGRESALDLALFRRHELVRIVLRDRLELGPLSQITEEISTLADAILGYALAHIESELKEYHGIPMSGSSPASFCILALGKLGGRELNYSSDVDLMFVYSGNGETTGPDVITNKEFFRKVANQYVSLLSTYTAAGLCYRVDLRLRPEGNLGEVAISLATAKDYYAKRARAWELQMLIKARVCAGNQDLGRELFFFVDPLIYTTTDDFSTIESMSATRERIGERLARRRRKEHEIDVKLAPGGIRDVEFLVQCLQRLHGAREVRVRHGSTLLALMRLYDMDLLSSTEYWRLSGAYEYFRRLEHLLQLEDDRQTHSLPSNPVELERVARRMLKGEGGPRIGMNVAAQLLRGLNQHLENVQAIYDRIVHAQRPSRYSPSPQLDATLEAITQFDENRPGMELSSDFLCKLSKPAPNLEDRLRTRGVKRAGRALTAFLEGLLAQPEQMELLDGHAGLTDWMLQIFELSPYLTDHLTRYPDLLEEIRRGADHPTRRWAFEGLAAPLTDVGALRRFYRREMFRIQVTSVCRPEYVFATLDNTSALAEFVIARAYRIALERALGHARAHSAEADTFVGPAAEMMVIALGRLGLREFDLASDADLLFILPDDESVNHLFWTRVAEHLIEILTTYTGDGAILSIDTRLRPNGREGLLVQTESAYVDYFSTSAKAWEGIAYMKARAVAGDAERATSFLNKLQQVDWRRYGQGGRSTHDLRQMRLKLQREQGDANPLKAAAGGYYDADFILMYLRLRGAGMFFKSLNTPERIDIVEKMGHLNRADAEFLLIATMYFRALDHAIRLVTGRKEEKIPSAPVLRVMIAELLQRWTGNTNSPSKLDTDLAGLQKKMRQVFEVIFT